MTPAREVLTPEEQAERELERKRQAEPVLECEPRSLLAEVKRGETKGLRFSIENAGGRGLHWAVISAPKWASPDRRSGELGYQEKRGVLVTLDPEGLPAGRTSGVIVVEGRDRGGKEVKGSPAAVRVTVDLEAEAEAEAPPEEGAAARAPAPGDVAREPRARQPSGPKGPPKPFILSVGIGGPVLTQNGAFAWNANIPIEVRMKKHALVARSGAGYIGRGDGDPGYEYYEDLRVVYRQYLRDEWYWEAGISRFCMTAWDGPVEWDDRPKQLAVGFGGKGWLSRGAVASFGTIQLSLMVGEGSSIPASFGYSDNQYTRLDTVNVQLGMSFGVAF